LERAWAGAQAGAAGGRGRRAGAAQAARARSRCRPTRRRPQRLRRPRPAPRCARAATRRRAAPALAWCRARWALRTAARCCSRLARGRPRAPRRWSRWGSAGDARGGVRRGRGGAPWAAAGALVMYSSRGSRRTGAGRPAALPAARRPGQRGVAAPFCPAPCEQLCCARARSVRVLSRVRGAPLTATSVCCTARRRPWRHGPCDQRPALQVRFMGTVAAVCICEAFVSECGEWLSTDL